MAPSRLQLSKAKDGLPSPNPCSRLPRWLSGEEFACNSGDTGSIAGSGRPSGEGNGNLLQYSCLKKPMDREPGGLQPMGSQRVGHDLANKQQ